MVKMATGRAPGRVNLLGEHTDYNRGLCLPVAIPYATTAVARRRADDVVMLVSRQQPESWSGTVAGSSPGAVDGWAGYAAGVLWALAELGHDVPGMSVEIDGDVPLGAGLSSSASLEGAVAAAAVGLMGLELDDDLRRTLVDVCIRAESEVVGAPTGGLDQTAALLAREGAALLLDFDSGAVTEVLLPLQEADLSVVVIDTRVSHAHTEGGYGDRRRECERAASALGVDSLRQAVPAEIEAMDDDVLRRRARHVVTENARVEAAVEAIAAGDWARVGMLMTHSHRSMRDDFEISCPELDLVVDVAVEVGAWGARMTGGGFGGSAIALVPAARVAALRTAVDAAFVRAGFAAPGHLDGTPSGPASVETD